MSTEELKKQLIDEIKEIENKELLQLIKRLLEFEREDFKKYRFSDDQKSAVNEERE